MGLIFALLLNEVDFQVRETGYLRMCGEMR